MSYGDFFVENYRGYDIYVTRQLGKPDQYYTPSLETFYTSLLDIQLAIDEILGGLEDRLEEVYKEAEIYYSFKTNDYFVIFEGKIFEHFAGLSDARAFVDALTAPPPVITPPVIPPVPPPLPPPIEIPTLPWYAAWLKPVLDYIGALTQSVVNFFANPIKAIGDGVGGIGATVAGIWDGLARAGPGVVKSVSDDLAAKTITGLGDAMKGTPQFVTDVAATLQPASAELEKVQAGISASGEAATGEPGQPSALDELYKWRDSIHEWKRMFFYMHAMTESFSLGQFEWMQGAQDVWLESQGLGDIMKKGFLIDAEKGLLKRAEQEANAKYMAEIPSYQDLITQVVKEVITLDQFKGQMQKLGFTELWSQRIWDAHFTPPDWTQLLNAYYRGEVTREELDSLMILVDLDPRYKKIFDAQIEQIPPYSELTNQLVKEVITQDEYTKYLQWYGFDKKWSKRIWDAHFIPPSLGDLLTAWRRGLIDEAELDRLMILVDLDPRYKNIFDTRKYVDPPLNMTRFLFETGNIDKAQVEENVKLQGYRPEHVEAITEYITEFQARLWRRRYITSLARGYELGVYSAADLEREVIAAEYTPDVAKYIVANADVRKKISESKVPVKEEPKLLSTGDLNTAFETHQIDEDRYRVELGVRGYSQSDIDLKVKLVQNKMVTEEAGGRKIALTQAELKDAWRYEQITEDQFRTEMLLRGLSLAEVEILIATSKLKWGVGGQ